MEVQRMTRVIVFDNETDGLINCNAIRMERWPRVIEFCGLIYEEGKLVDEVEFLIDPLRKISQEITDITGIKNEDLVGKPRLPNVWANIVTAFESCDVAVAHNCSFDVNVLDLEATRLALPKIQWPELFCTVENTEHLLGRRMKLSELHTHLFNEEFKGAHRARVDVEATARCYFEIMRKP
jgi:DNA polymerase III subunit epsilon